MHSHILPGKVGNLPKIDHSISIAACKYGDHETYCATMQKHQCSDNADTCCKRCAELRDNNNNNPGKA